MSKKESIATFAGGCFWCTVSSFDSIPGVKKVISGYTGGSKKDPTYEEVCSGTTGHLEAVQVFYDSNKTKYEQLLDFFWKSIDPTDDKGQFVDRGSQYSSAIFYHDETQKRLAEESKKKLAASEKFDKPIVTEIRKFVVFYPAQVYHQDFHKKSPLRYKMYRMGSGRDQYLDHIWGKGKHG